MLERDTSIVYLTEDDFRGSIPADPNTETDASCARFLYRYLPSDRSQRPGGDIWCAEDGGGENRIVGITPEGGTYVFARNAHPDMNEFAGPTFAPDGQTFFVNVQDPGTTFAIWGPFARQNRARQRQMAHADPPAGYGPLISGELAEAAQRYGLTKLEAAAYQRLGIPLV
jgi:uncharacterized protein